MQDVNGGTTRANDSGRSDTGAGGCSAGAEARRYAPQLGELPDGCEHPAAFPPRGKRRGENSGAVFFPPGMKEVLERMEQSEEERRANKAQTRELYERDTTLRDSAVDSLRAKIEKVESPTNTLDEARFAEEPSD